MELPPLPRAAVRILELCESEDAEFSDIAEVAGTDPAIAALVLRTVNAAGRGLRQSVNDIQTAISLLGLTALRSRVAAAGAMRALPEDAPGFDPVRFWQVSLQRATFAQELASVICPREDGEAFAGALLQNMALPILLTQWARDYEPLYRSALENGEALIDVEERELTWTHCQAGAWMARKWSFPDALVCCVGLHHLSWERLCELELADSPVAATSLSSLLPDGLEQIQSTLGLEDEAFEDLLDRANEACCEIAAHLGVPPPKSLAPAGLPGESSS